MIKRARALAARYKSKTIYICCATDIDTIKIEPRILSVPWKDIPALLGKTSSARTTE